MNALQDAADRLESLNDDAGAVEAATAEQEAVETLVSGVAKALANGLNKPAGFYAGALADECDYNTKTDIKQQISDKVTEYRGADKQPLDEFVANRLETVHVTKSTDESRGGAGFRWDFGDFQVQTRAGKERRGHFNWQEFRNLIHESAGQNLAPPQKDRRGGEEWREFMNHLQETRQQIHRVRGARTEAVEKLENRVKTTTGYGTPESALDHGGVWVVVHSHDLPSWWAAATDRQPSEARDLDPSAVEQVRVHESDISGIIDDVEIARSALYQEISARGHTVPGTDGPSMRKYVNGSRERFWTLSPSLETPRTYVPDSYADVSPGRLFGETGEEEEQQPTDPEPDAAKAATDGSGESDDDDSGGFDSVGDTL